MYRKIPPISDDIIKKAKELYEEGYSLKKIGNIFNILPQTIHYYLRKIIHIRTPEEASIKFRYLKNESYFDNIDSHNKAYFLGLIIADGHVSKNTNSISLYQNKIDEYIFDSINKELESKIPIKYDDRCAFIVFKSKHMKKILNSMNIFNDKSYTSTFPKIDNKFNSSFIRGVFDGDGYIGIIDKRKDFYNYCIHFVGTESLMNSIKDIIYNECGVKAPKLVTTISSINGIYKLSYGGNKKVGKVCEYMYNYSDESTRLGRKYLTYLEYKEFYKWKKFSLL